MKDRLLAVIDIGSHTIKLHIGEVVRKHSVKPIEYLWVPVTIGRDAFSRGTLSNSTIQEAAQAVKRYREVIESYQIKRYQVVASANIREASNADVLFERVEKVSGLPVTVVEPEDETVAVYRGVQDLLHGRFGLDKKTSLLLSVGGGTTQLVVESAGRVVLSETHHVGTVKLVRDADFSEKSYQFTLHPFSLQFINTLRQYPGIGKPDAFVTVNDDILAVAQRFFMEHRTEGVYRIPRKVFLVFIRDMEKISLENMKEQFGLTEHILKTTRLAILLIYTFFNLTDAQYLLLPDRSTSYFMLYRLAFLEDRSVLAPELEDNIISSAMALGRKYQFDQEHAVQVERLALQIFDDLRDPYGLTARERVYLRVAALLHDIGTFVSANSHNKHSAQLINCSEIIGLSRGDMRIVALLARYHRKSPPRASHIDYIDLPMEKRLIVSRLSAILRIADALDTAHFQQVERVISRFAGERCEIQVKMKDYRYEYFDIIRASVKKKSDMFEGFFGCPVKLEMLR